MPSSVCLAVLFISKPLSAQLKPCRALFGCNFSSSRDLMEKFEALINTFTAPRCCCGSTKHNAALPSQALRSWQSLSRLIDSLSLDFSLSQKKCTANLRMTFYSTPLHTTCSAHLLVKFIVRIIYQEVSPPKFCTYSLCADYLGHTSSTRTQTWVKSTRLIWFGNCVFRFSLVTATLCCHGNRKPVLSDKIESRRS